MTNETDPQILRLRKRHTPSEQIDAGPEDGERLVQAQSFGNAVIASLIVVVLFSIIWAMLSTAIDRVFPWLTIVLGFTIGLVVRRVGRGLDWRFPVLAAFITLFGALVGNVVVAAAFTAEEFETGTLQILRAVTTMTWPVFFDEVMSVADLIYALAGAIFAAYYANRRLSRRDYLALRRFDLKKQHGR